MMPTSPKYHVPMLQPRNRELVVVALARGTSREERVAGAIAEVAGIRRKFVYEELHGLLQAGILEQEYVEVEGGRGTFQQAATYDFTAYGLAVVAQYLHDQASGYERAMVRLMARGRELAKDALTAASPTTARSPAPPAQPSGEVPRHNE